jgi:hypothetical protein
MKKVAFEQVQLQLDLIYNTRETDPSKIDHICDFAIEFVESCGWEINDYIGKMLGLKEVN